MAECVYKPQMCMKNLFLLGSALVASFPCLSEIESATTYIVNGSSASTGTFDTFVSLYYDNGSVYSTSPYCGGSIIDTTHILTAAHCIFDGSGSIDDETGRYISVVQSDDVVDLDTTSIPIYTVSKIYYRNDYNDNKNTLWANDIAVLELSSAISTSASTAPVSDESSYRNSSDEFIAVGFGKTSSTESTSDVLLQTSLNYIDCGSDARLTDSHLCFDGEVSATTTLNNATCQGDSGGPIYWNDGGNYLQVGIISFGPTICGDPTQDYVTGSTEVSDYASWITAIQNNSPLSVTLSCEVPNGTCPTPSGGSSSITSSSSSGGGGSIPLFSSLCLLIVALVRKHRH